MATIVFTGGATLEVQRQADAVRADIERAVAEARPTLSYVAPGARPDDPPAVVFHERIAYVTDAR